jgi:hypothetical protein
MKSVAFADEDVSGKKWVVMDRKGGEKKTGVRRKI